MEIKAFRGWRYVPSVGGDVSEFIAPPYDILSAADKRELLGRSDKNIVAVDLPHVPPKEVGPDSEYQAAAARLAEWKAGGVLRQESAPAVYAYEQTFEWAGRTYSRKAMIAGVRATPFGEDVIPHEHTFAGPKADRLKLTQYTGMQLSPIFGFFDDAAAGISQAMWDAAAKVQPVVGTMRAVGAVGEKLWPITDAGAIARIGEGLRRVPVFIADGHHRYTTAMNYRDALKAAGKIDDKHEANFVMFALVPEEDSGLLILPTHRLIKGLGGGYSLAKLAASATEFQWRKLGVKDVNLTYADEFLAGFGPTAMAFVDSPSGEIWIATLKDSAAMDAAAPGEVPAWRKLDVAILHTLIIDKALAAWKGAGLAIEYTPDGQAVQAACRGGAAQLGVCLQSTPLAAVREIAMAGATMPHKSTYFYPKLATGLVLKPLE